MNKQDNDLIIKLADGNIGALKVILELIMYQGVVDVDSLLLKMDANGIIGSRLYMLWNDCCDRNTQKTIAVMQRHTIEDIVEHINFHNGRGIPYADEEAPPIEKRSIFL